MATTNDDLARLLAKVALRDRAAFEAVSRATCAHLLGVAFRILKQRERAEEALQEDFMNVWHNAAGFNPGLATPMTWRTPRWRAIRVAMSPIGPRPRTTRLPSAGTAAYSTACHAVGSTSER